jgi:transposase-like protein
VLTIVTVWTRSIESYVAAGAGIDVPRPRRCPGCGGTKLIFWGKRRRQATDGGCDMVLFVRRVRCASCKRTHTILPAFLFRGRVYLAETILSALDLVFQRHRGVRGAAAALGLCRSTVSRWIKRFRSAAASICHRLAYLYYTHFPGAPPPPAKGDAACRALVLGRYLFAASRGQRPDIRQLARWLSAAFAGAHPFLANPSRALTGRPRAE